MKKPQPKFHLSRDNRILTIILRCNGLYQMHHNEFANKTFPVARRGTFLQKIYLNDIAPSSMQRRPNFTTAIYPPKLASTLKGIHHSKISHRVKIFIDIAGIIAAEQTVHTASRSYRNARNLMPLLRLSNVYTIDCLCPSTEELFS